MGMDATIEVFGPFKILRDLGALNYPEAFYGEGDENDIVHGCVVVANTSSESEFLAEICGVGPWDLRHHRVTKPKLPLITWESEHYHLSGYEPDELYELLKKLVSHPDVQIWYLPNG